MFTNIVARVMSCRAPPFLKRQSARSGNKHAQSRHERLPPKQQMRYNTMSRAKVMRRAPGALRAKRQQCGVVRQCGHKGAIQNNNKQDNVLRMPANAKVLTDIHDEDRRGGEITMYGQQGVRTRKVVPPPMIVRLTPKCLILIECRMQQGTTNAGMSSR